MVDSLFILKKCLHYFGLLPNYNEKRHTFTPSKFKALFASATYTTVICVNVIFVQKRNGFFNSEFKIVSDWLLFLAIISWMICNNTRNADKLTSITRLLIGTKLPLNKCVTIILVYNIVFFLVIVAINVHLIITIVENYWQIFSFAIEVYASQCITFMYSTKILFIVLMYGRWSKMNQNLERLLDGLPVHPQLVSQIIAEHNLVNNLADLFNDVFGFESLIIKFYEMTNILAVLNVLLERNASDDLAVLLFVWVFYISVSKC